MILSLKCNHGIDKNSIDNRPTLKGTHVHNLYLILHRFMVYFKCSKWPFPVF